MTQPPASCLSQRSAMLTCGLPLILPRPETQRSQNVLFSKSSVSLQNGLILSTVGFLTAVTNYDQLSALKNNTVILFQFWRSEVPDESHSDGTTVGTGVVPSEGESALLAFQLLVGTGILAFVAPSTSCKARHSSLFPQPHCLPLL